MTKPQDFREQRTIRCDTHYQVHEGFPKGSQSGSGVLTIGRIVWVQNEPEVGDAGTMAFADGIGIISVDPQSISNHVPQ